MGRTLLPFRMALEEELTTWKKYRNNLPLDDKLIFDQLMQAARTHADAGSLAARPLLSEVIFMSIAIEQQHLLNVLNDKIKMLRKNIAEVVK